MRHALAPIGCGCWVAGEVSWTSLAVIGKEARSLLAYFDVKVAGRVRVKRSASAASNNVSPSSTSVLC